MQLRTLIPIARSIAAWCACFLPQPNPLGRVQSERQRRNAQHDGQAQRG
jgi:hypothetical protein